MSPSSPRPRRPQAWRRWRPWHQAPVGSYPELIGSNERGILVDLFDSHDSDYEPPDALSPDKIDELSTAVSSLLLDPACAYDMGRRAAEWVSSRYDWSVIALEVEHLYVQ